LNPNFKGWLWKLSGTTPSEWAIMPLDGTDPTNDTDVDQLVLNDAKSFRADDQYLAQIPTFFVLILGFWVWLMLGCWYRVMTDTRFSFSLILQE
jgi:hypothetical protein